MNGYRPMLFQKLTEGSEIRNSTDWNIYVKKVPFKPIGDLKTPYVQNYKDRDGNDVCYPSTPRYEAYDLKCDFAYMGPENTASPMVVLFIKYLVENGLFKFFDTYTNIGKTNVNYKSNDAEQYFNSDQNVVVFSITFTINDPVTDVFLEETT